MRRNGNPLQRFLSTLAVPPHPDRARCSVTRSLQPFSPHALPLCLLILIGLFVGILARDASAQIPFFGRNELESETPEQKLQRRLPHHPQMLSALAQGIEFLEQGNSAAAIEILQSILDRNGDFFLYAGESDFESFRENIEQRIREHRDEYQRVYGEIAENLLKDAGGAERREQLEEVVRRFAMTDAGARAMLQLANLMFDQGQFVASARLYERLLEHPRPRITTGEVALRIVAAWNKAGQAALATDRLQQFADAIQAEAARHPESFPAADLLASPAEWIEKWSPSRPVAYSTSVIDQWHTRFGSARRSGQVAFAPAIREGDWTYPLIDEFDTFRQDSLADATSLLSAIERRLRATEEEIALPVASPLIIGDLAIFAGYGACKAVDLNTGELRWSSSEVDPTFEYLWDRSYTPDEHDQLREDMLEMFFSVRGWRDLTAASLSADDSQVYWLTGCNMVRTVNPHLLIQNPLKHPLLPRRDNQLHALDLDGGALKWSRGGGRIAMSGFGIDFDDDAESQRLDNVFFYGAPLVVDGRLYCVGEERGQIQLFVLDRDGHLVWSLGLLNPDGDLILDSTRRIAGLSPTFAEGLMICPTGEGVLTAVDIIQRRVVWTHQYGVDEETSRTQRMANIRVRRQQETLRLATEELLSDDRWFDSNIIVAGEHLIYTPPDSDALVCLRLADGQAAWPQAHWRHQSLFVATADEERVVVVGRGDVDAYRMSDGSRAWEEPTPIPPPSGRGYRMGQTYVLPLATAEIAVIDLETGQLLCRSELPSGRPVGNLVSTRGRIVSQTGTHVSALVPRETLKEEQQRLLADETQLASGLALRGEMQLQAGNMRAGLEDLRKAIEKDPNARLKHLLSWSLLDGLRTDFEQYQEYANEIESNIADAKQRAMFLRIYADGLRESGRPREALARYLQLLTGDWSVDELEDLDSNWSVRTSRWLAGQFETLFDTADDAARAELQADLEQWVTTEALANTEIAARTLMMTQPDWIDVELWLELIDAASEAEQPASRIRNELLRLVHHDDPAVRVAVHKRLAVVALKLSAGDVADRHLDILTGELAKVAGPWGVRGEEHATALEADDQYRSVLQAVPEWPTEVAVAEDEPPVTVPQLHPIPYNGTDPASTGDWSFFVDTQGTQLWIFDQHGRMRGRVDTDVRSNRQYAIGPHLGRYVTVHGHIAAVVLLDRVLLLDLQSNPAVPQLLATQSLIPEEASPFNRRGIVLVGQRNVPGMRTSLIRTPTGVFGGNASPLTSRVFCCGYGTDLIALDPTTGERLWVRHDFPVAAEILADDRYVLIKPQGENVLQVLRAADGKRLGTQPLPEGVLKGWRDAEWGRLIPTVVPGETEKTSRWAMFDPMTQANVWEHQLEAGECWAPVDGRHVAFLKSDGRYVIRHGSTGATIVSGEIPDAISCRELSVLTYPEQQIFVIERDTRVPKIVASINSSTGQVEWSQSVIALATPEGLPNAWPVLTFIGRALVERTETIGALRRPRTVAEMRVVILNRHTGEQIVDATHRDTGEASGWIGHLQPMKMGLRFGRAQYTLLGRDEEVAPDSDDENAPSKNDGDEKTPPPQKAEPRQDDSNQPDDK